MLHTNEVLQKMLLKSTGVVVIWVMMITTLLTSLVMLVIWKTNILLVLTFLLPYTLIEAVFMTSLLNKIPQGGWVPFAISAFFMTIMLSWTYGRSKKATYEADHKMSVTELDALLSSPNIVHRVPGVCFFFTDLVYGIPPIIRHYIRHTNSAREVIVVVTLRTLPIKNVLCEERLVVGKLGSEGVYRCLVQFGYKDSQDMNGGEFVDLVVGKLGELGDNVCEKEKIQREAGEGNVFVVGRTILRANKESGRLARFVIDCVYRFLQKNSRAAVSALEIPAERTLQIGMVYEI